MQRTRSARTRTLRVTTSRFVCTSLEVRSAVAPISNAQEEPLTAHYPAPSRAAPAPCTKGRALIVFARTARILRSRSSTTFSPTASPDDTRPPPAAFAAWCDGRTGYPLVDAAMLQLNQTGYMHNRLRMVAASFLAKDLGIDWRLGERYFADLLNDFDFSANNGGWQWAASTGYGAQPYSRIFNPVTRSEKFDPDGALSNDIYRGSRTCRQNGFTRGGWPARSGSRNSVHGTGRELSRTDRRPGTGPRAHTGLIRKVSACSHY
ncbi:hypothetical protein OKW37_004569 [Paraburkholderia sp. MM5482-R2]